ncbi:hypothetical protein FJU08_05030 [Martelella alba]|uniref:Uncharacterized protein n=2 Tax=Martelella alba TaxID=2590451 RepID=A0A506UG56_9HYPH|nr:hypothetical protein FJU08_05030 [Martelella alba]
MSYSERTRDAEDAMIRVDPQHFPQKFSYAAKGAEARIGVKLDERGAVVRRDLPSSKLPFSIALPGRAFKGVAARAIAHREGKITVTLELHHSDPEMCIPLLVTHDLNDIVADWQNWSSLYDIPMLMVEADGIARPLANGADVIRPANDTENTGTIPARKSPRTMMRLKGGKLGVSMKYTAKTIAAG